jgi:prolipoprotein diacylglyceryltransferase/protein-S-isoprenylcysteine O-methyltransferase Ste14
LGQFAYGTLFVVVLPILLAVWAMFLDRRLTLPDDPSALAGWLLAAVGAIVVGAAVIELRVRGGGWPMSPYPPERLVTSGIYRWMAHPIYAGCAMLLAGVSIGLRSPAGLWIVTPLFIGICIAWVWGNEGERTVAQFGERTPAILHLPSVSDDRPSVASRLSVYFIAILPWYLIYEGINELDTPRDAIAVASSWDALVPVIGWTEILYFLAYPIVLAAPLVAKRSAGLRTLTVRAWIATAGAALCYLTIPTMFEKKPVPPSPFASWLEWERAFDAPNTALPAFHVIWVMLAMDIYVHAFPRWRALAWPAVAAIAVSCVTTGMHAIVDVIAGLVLGLVFVRIESVWSVIVSAAEKLSNSWHEWRIGPIRIINHGMFGGAAITFGIIIATALAGNDRLDTVVVVAAAIVAGAALWAQFIEGSPALLRPYGYYGGLLGGMAAIAITSSIQHTGFLVLAAYAVAATAIQAIGRLRCVIQGCCHGRPAQSGGVRVQHPQSRIVRIAHLADVPLHPTALYSILVNLFCGALLLRLWIAAAPLGFIAGTYLVLTGLGRFVEEHYRGEPQTRVIGGLRLYQWMAMGSVVAGAMLMSIPSSPAPAPQLISAATLVTALAAGVLGAAAYGLDFPESSRRFARLA